MNARHMRLVRKLAALLACFSMLTGAIAPAFAQGDEHGVVGWEVKSTNTPGGGGGLTSQGLTGESTPWAIAEAGPSVAGTAVVNIVIRYYHCEECWKKAKEEKKKKEEEAKKKKADDKKKKKDGDKKPPQGPNVPTFDPRTHELKDGKVVPKDPKDVKPGRLADEHKWCDAPSKFECGNHFQWWLKNHEHRTEAPKDQKQGKIETEMQPMHLQGSNPRIVMTGTVVADEEASISVVEDNTGAILTGVVVELPNGEKATTDAKGQAKFRVPKGIEALTLLISGTQIARKSWAWPSAGNPGGWDRPEVHYYSGSGAQINPPSVIQPGQEVPVQLEGVNGKPDIRFGSQPAEIRAWSPTGCIVKVPSDMKPGTHAMALYQNGKPVDIETVDNVKIEVEAPKTILVGKMATYTVRVIGTDRKLDLRLTNLNSGVADLAGKASDNIVQSSGGKHNKALVDIQPKMMGPILVAVDFVPASLTNAVILPIR